MKMANLLPSAAPISATPTCKAGMQIEHQVLEWKSTWKDDHLREICAFANAQGGILCIGKDDQGRVTGVPESAARKLLENLPNKVRDVTGVQVDVNLHAEGDLYWVEVVVPAVSTPVSCRGEFYYRSGSVCQQLTGSALTHFLLEKTGAQWDGISVDRVPPADLDSISFEIFQREALKNRRMNPEDFEISLSAAVFSLGALFLLSWEIGVAAIILLVLISVLPQLANKKLQKANEARSKALETGTESYKDVIMGGSVFFLSDLKERIVERILYASEKSEKVCFRYNITNATVRSFVMSVSMIGQIVLLFVTLLAVVAGSTATGAVLSVGNLSFPRRF